MDTAQCLSQEDENKLQIADDPKSHSQSSSLNLKFEHCFEYDENPQENCKIASREDLSMNFQQEHELWLQIDSYALKIEDNFDFPIQTERKLFYFENTEAILYLEPNLFEA